MGVGRNDDHEVRRDPVGPLGAGRPPVREVRHLDQHRGADLVDVERQALRPHLEVGHLDGLDRPPLGRLAPPDPLPLVGAAGGQRDVPLVGVDEPPHRRPAEATLVVERLLEPLDLGVADVGEHRGLVGQRLDQRAVGHLEHDPRRRLGQLGQVGVLAGGGDGLGRSGHVVAHAQHLQVVDAPVDVERAVRQVALRRARPGRQLDLGQEVERGGRRRLEVQALHRADAAVGPVRQQHQGHGRAVAVELPLVLPEGAAAAVLLADLLHGQHDVAVLAVRLLLLVAAVVPPGPRRDEALGLGVGLERAEAGPVEAGARALVERQGAERHADEHERHHQHRQRGGHARRDRPGPHHPGPLGDQPHGLGHAQPGQEQHGQVVEGQQPAVPEAPLGRHHEGHADADRRDQQEQTGPQAGDDRHHRPEQRQPERPPQIDVRRLVGEQVLPERLVLVGQLLPPHVVEVGAAQVEGPHPEQRQQPTDDHDRRQPADALGRQPQRHRHRRHAQAGQRQHGKATNQAKEGADQQRVEQQGHAESADRHARLPRAAGPVEPDEHRHRRRPQHPERHDQVAQAGQRQQDRGPAPVAAGLQALHDHAHVDDAEAEGHGEGELAGQGRGDVAAVDREAPVEEERQRGDGQDRRGREPEVGEPPERVGGHRQRDQAADRHQLERHAVGQADEQQRGDGPHDGQVAGPRLGPPGDGVGHQARAGERR